MDPCIRSERSRNGEENPKILHALDQTDYSRLSFVTSSKIIKYEPRKTNLISPCFSCHIDFYSVSPNLVPRFSPLLSCLDQGGTIRESTELEITVAFRTRTDYICLIISFLCWFINSGKCLYSFHVTGSSCC